MPYTLRILHPDNMNAQTFPYMVARKEPQGDPYAPLAAFTNEGHARQHARLLSTQSLAVYCVLERTPTEVHCILETSRGLTVEGVKPVATLYWETYALHLKPALPLLDPWSYGETLLDPDDGLPLQEAYEPISDSHRTLTSHLATAEQRRLKALEDDYRRDIERAADSWKAGAPSTSYLEGVKL